MMIITPGDILSRRKGLFTHKGVFLGKGKVFHILPGGSAEVCTWEQFAAGKRVRVRELSDALRVRVLTAVTRELESGRRYHPLRNNCQHLVNRLYRGVSYSEELLASLLFVAGAAALVVAKVRR
jgi:hypothetical protein